MESTTNISKAGAKYTHQYPYDMKHQNTNLSDREREIISLVGRGQSTKMIARKLFLSEDTINTHRKNINRKMRVNNGFEAVRNWTLIEGNRLF